jgi:CMD domain protein
MAASSRRGSVVTTIDTPDVVDRLLGVVAGDRLDLVRRVRPVARTQAQVSYEQLLDPREPGGLSVAERLAVAYVVAGLHDVEPVTAHYRRELQRLESRPDVVAAFDAVVAAGAGTGPFGAFREPGLADRSTDGVRLRIGAAERDVLGDELSALLEHAHALVLRPRETGAESLEALTAVGWGADEIVAASQLVAFLAFQIRLVAGLDALRSTWAEAA